MEEEHQDEKGKNENEKRSSQTEKYEKQESEFLTKVFDAFDQDDDRKNIYIQYRIVNNHGIMASDSARIETICANGKEEGKQKKKNRNIFSDAGKRNKWVVENYEAYPMALMIAVAVFDTMPYMWVVRAADALYETYTAKKDIKEKRYGITEMLSQFGAVICKGKLNTYTGMTPVDIVRLEKKSLQEEILKYIWIECPQLQDMIMTWLEKYYKGKIISMSKRAGEIMGWLACWDFHYFLNNVVNQIHIRNSISTDMMIAQIVTALEKKREFQENVDKLLENWSKERNVHYLITGIFVCAGQEGRSDILETIISVYIDRALKELQREEVGEYLKLRLDFFAAGMRAFTFYRILIEKLYELMCGDSSPGNIRNVCRLFWILFNIDIQLARFEKGEDAIFVRIAMQNDSTGKRLRYLWETMWRDRSNRATFYYFLAEYDKRAGIISGYNLERMIQKVFGDICDEELQMDICSKIRRRSVNE